MNTGRLRKLFEEARELPVEQRAAFLDQACGDDRELRKEIESLLEAEQGIGSFLDGDRVGQSLSEALAGIDDSLVGRTVGGYRVLELIARGGMGVVYRAEQDSPDRQVALKLMTPGFLSSEIARRFEVEVQVMGRLQHPGIAQIFEAGTAEIDHVVRPFFAMEFIDGLPVTKWAEENSLDLRSRLELMIRICEAVRHAHRKGVIHRDLKPANILVDGHGQPKVLDFGVARGADADLQATQIGSRNVLLGTLAYMSPEQVRGDTAELDTRSDVYSLGAIGFELLAGHPLHKLDGKSITEAIRIVTEGGSTDLTSAVRLMPQDVGTIIRKMLEVDPAERYDSVAALIVDLRRFLDNRPILARPPSALYHFRKLVSRNRIASGLSSLLLVLVVGFGVVAVVQNSRIRAERDHAHREAATAEQVSDFLQELFAAPAPGVSRGEKLTAREMLDRGAAKVRSDLAGQPLVQARLMVLMGKVYLSLGVPDEARPLLEQGIQLGRTVVAEDAGPVVSGLQSLAWLHRSARRYEDGLEAAREARRISETYSGTDEEADGDLLITLGVLLRDRGEFEEAQAILEKALVVNEKIRGPRSRQVGGALNHLAWLEFKLGNTEKSLETYESACPILEESIGADNPALAWCLNDHSLVLSSSHRNEEAREKLRQALDIWEKVLPPGHPYLAIAAGNLGALFNDVLDYENALLHYRRALEIRRQALPPDHPDVGDSLCNVAYIERNMKRWKEAESDFLEGIAIMEAALGPDDENVRNNLLGLAHLYKLTGRYQDADAIYDRLVESVVRTLGEDDPLVASALELNAYNLILLERYDEAESTLRRAQAIVDRPSARGKLGLCLQHRGELEQAETVLKEALKQTEPADRNNASDLSDLLFYLSKIPRARGDHDQADRYLSRALDLRRSFRPESQQQVLYFQAVLQARTDREASLALLRRALDSGWPPYAVDRETDFKGIDTSPAFD